MSEGVAAAVLYTIKKCGLGEILVAASKKGVCAVMLGESPAELEREILTFHPTSQRIDTDVRLTGLAENLVNLAEGRDVAAHTIIPLDVRATDFQKSVWDELVRIPRGETRSYAEVAKAIGRPKAFRPVARACATNPVCVVVPCHRVVRSDGDLSGFRWGRERKAALLASELQSAKGLQFTPSVLQTYP